MKEITINEKISYIPASDNPLSADIGIIRVGGKTWLFDVGNDERSIEGLDGTYNVVLSHFHADHVGNLEKISCKELFISKETYDHVLRGTVVRDSIAAGNLRVFPIPSSHTKGCLGLEVDGTYAFVGDALYSKVKDGCYVYNAQLLKDEIAVLKGLQASFLLVSHFDGLIRRKEEVLAELEEIYEMRTKNEAYIKVGIT